MVKIGIAPTHHDDDRPFFNDFSIIYNYHSLLLILYLRILDHL